MYGGKTETVNNLRVFERTDGMGKIKTRRILKIIVILTHPLKDTQIQAIITNHDKCYFDFYKVK